MSSFSNSYFIKRVFQFLAPYKANLYSSILWSVVNKILDLMPPVLVAWVVDSLNRNPPSFLEFFIDTSDPFAVGMALALLAIIIFGFESLFQWGYQSGFMRLAQRLQHDLRISTYKKIQSREMDFFDNHRLGETMAMLNDDVNQLERFFNRGFNDIIQLFVLFAFAGYIFINTSLSLALIGLIPIPLIIIGSLFYQKIVQSRYTNVRESLGNLSSRLENNLSGISIIKSFTAEEYELKRVESASKEYKEKNFHAIKVSSLYVPVIRTFVAIGFAGVLLVGSYRVLQNEGALTIGGLVLFSMMIQRVLWPLTELGETLDEYERAKASAKRIFSLLDTKSSIVDSLNPVALPTVKNGAKIEFKNVSFSYHPYSNLKSNQIDNADTEIPIFNNINFCIEKGTTVGFAGFTGSGKTSLIKLLLRFYDISNGTISLDNIDIKNIALKDLRNSISLVSQDMYLFYGTIYENIAYGIPNANMQAVENAAKIAELHTFANSLKNGYHTLVGERGIKLSGGQRQRLSIARAILKNAPVIILDEATSSVDTQTEFAIQKNLKKITRGKTAIIIAHRLSTIRHADKIFVLDNGKIIEEGNHNALLRKKGMYTNLWKLQIGDASKI